MSARRLLVLVAVALAAGAASLTAARSPAGAVPTRASAPKLVTRNIHFYRTSIGGLVFFGEILDRGPGPAANVGLLLGLLNDRGERLARGATLRISTNVLKPGARGVWVVQMSDNPKKWARMQIQVAEQIGREDALAQDYTSFKVGKVEAASENPGFSQKVTGTLTNAGRKPARVSSVTIALYDARGTLVYATNQGFLYPYSSKQVVPPRKTAPFKASILGYTKKPAKIVVYVRASTKGSNGFYLG